MSAALLLALWSANPCIADLRADYGERQRYCKKIPNLVSSVTVSEEDSDYPATLWVSPRDIPVALRYQRADSTAPWLITGMVMADDRGIGAAWFKAFRWRRLGNPLDAFDHGGYVWDYEPTVGDLAKKWTYDPALGFSIRRGDPRAPSPKLTAEQPASRGNPFKESMAGAAARQAAQEAKRETDPEGYEAEQQRVRDQARQLMERVERGRRYVLNDEHYRAVAEAYRLAQVVMGKPTSHIALHYGVPYSTAGNWVREARKRGFLPPTTKGRTS